MTKYKEGYWWVLYKDFPPTVRYLHEDGTFKIDDYIWEYLDESESFKTQFLYRIKYDMTKEKESPIVQDI